MNVVIPKRSMIMMIGGSGCGKSHFIANKLVPQLCAMVPNANIQVLSSDDYRREIIGENLVKTDDRMSYASNGAFKIMEAKFDAVTTWPITADFVVIDSTNIGAESRQMWVDKAKKARYQLVGFCFDFNDREEYFKYVDPSDGWLVGKHLKRFKTETMGEIRKRDFDYFYKVKSKSAELIIDKDPSYDTGYILPSFAKYFVVGDIHSCLDEFKALLISVGFTITDNIIAGNTDTLIVLVGDVVDKGPLTNETIEFIHANRSRIKVTIGNHDSALLRFITKGVNDKLDNERIAKYFDAFAKMNEVSKKQFVEIMDESKYFYIHDHFVVTHAPCPNAAIGKFDPKSLKDQNNCPYGWRKDFDSNEAFAEGVKKSISFVFDEARKQDPYHFFGHIAVTEALTVGNKIFLDSGSCYGNRLSGAMFTASNRSISIKSVPSSFKPEGDIGDIVDFNSARKELGVKFNALDYEDKMDVVFMARNKVNYISGTMSPCDKNTELGTLEDIREALSYYKSKGIDSVMLQKKYMGSRATMYLFPGDMTKCYMTSRNGYVIKKLDLSAVYQKTLDGLANKDFEMIVIDGELMPWSAMGKGLIDSHFKVTGVGIESELSVLASTGFEGALNDLRNTFESSTYKGLKREMRKEELIKTVGEGVYRQLSSFDGFKWLPIDDQRHRIGVYNKQIELYGSEGELDFKGFALLKTIDNNGIEATYYDKSNEEVFNAVSKDEYITVDTNSGLDTARAWFEARMAEGIEGVVVKPANKVYTAGVAPYLKVRNPNYLTIIYGYDYASELKFPRMLEHKSIKNKLRMSIKEFEIGKAMMEIPYDSIDEHNVVYLDLCARMVVEERREKELDPRL